VARHLFALAQRDQFAVRGFEVGGTAHPQEEVPPNQLIHASRVGGLYT
jgi:hypothetical protein